MVHRPVRNKPANQHLRALEEEGETRRTCPPKPATVQFSIECVNCTGDARPIKTDGTPMSEEEIKIKPTYGICGKCNEKERAPPKAEVMPATDHVTAARQRLGRK